MIKRVFPATIVSRSLCYDEGGAHLKRLHRLLAVTLLPVMLINAGGCSRKTTTRSTVQKSASSQQASSSQGTPDTQSPVHLHFSLPYSNVQNFNPILPVSQFNASLWPLMYDCLSEPGPDFSPVMQLASSVTVKGNAVTVTLKNGIKFTDGTYLSSSDVVKTFHLAMSHPESPFHQRTVNISSISTPSSGSVIFNLTSPDPMFANMLDIPIVKDGGAASGFSIGTGKYIYTPNGVNGVLNVNKGWYKGTVPVIQRINLVNVPNQAAVTGSLSIGTVNYLYTDTGGSANTIIGTQAAAVNVNQITYVGVNTSKAPLSNPHFRRALSDSVDRSTLCSQTLSGMAFGTALPFNPVWPQQKADAKELNADLNAAASEITQAGGASAASGQLTLLTDNDNQSHVAVANFLAGCFGKSGINVTVKAVPFADYQASLNSGSYDLYIGETKIDNDMNISPLLTTGSGIAFGVPANSSSLAAFQKWQSGSADIASVAAAFKSEMPIIPLYYKKGQVLYSQGLSGVSATDGDIYYNIENWRN